MRDEQRAFQEFANAIETMGRRLSFGGKLTATARKMRGVARGSLTDSNLHTLRGPVDELRAVVDELATFVADLRTVLDELSDLVGVDN